jgi:hypothetical protein
LFLILCFSAASNENRRFASLFRAETAVAASDAALADDEVNVFLALGGGWQS